MSDRNTIAQGIYSFRYERDVAAARTTVQGEVHRVVPGVEGQLVLGELGTAPRLLFANEVQAVLGVTQTVIVEDSRL